MYRIGTGKPNNLIAFILVALLVLMMPVPALAAAGASFNGDDATSVWEYDSVSVTAHGFDLFGAVTKDLVPGDVRSISVSLRNNASDPVDFRLAARSLSTAEVRYLEAAYPGKIADDSLLDVIDITVRYGATVLYGGTLRGVSTSNLYSSAGAPIGRVSAGWAGTVTVELSLRAVAGNALMDRLCAIEWVFIAAQYNDDKSIEPPVEPPVEPPIETLTVPTTPASGDGTGAAAGGGADTTVVVVDDTPISDLPDGQTSTTSGVSPSPDVVIEADSVPQAAGNKGASWALLNLILTIVSGILMFALMVRFLLSRSRERQGQGADVSGSDATAGCWTASGASASAVTEERVEAHTRLKGIFWLVGTLAIIASVVLFILTEDMRLPMQWADNWTLCHALIVLIEVILLLLFRTKRSQTSHYVKEGKVI
jgi:hypothetical protein